MWIYLYSFDFDANDASLSVRVLRRLL